MNNYIDGVNMSTECYESRITECYKSQFTRELSKSRRPLRILMHVCCGPCAAWPMKRFTEDNNFELAAVFYNPNIHPKDEFEKRKEGAVQIAKNFSVPLSVYNDYMQREWEEFERTRHERQDRLERTHNARADMHERARDSRQDERSERCGMCYGIRLGFVAEKAKETGYDAFTTSLLISPYQDHNLIKELGEKYQKEFNISFYYEDFRPAFREGQMIAKNMGVYRQKYCGCIISLDI